MKKAFIWEKSKEYQTKNLNFTVRRKRILKSWVPSYSLELFKCLS